MVVTREAIKRALNPLIPVEEPCLPDRFTVSVRPNMDHILSDTASVLAGALASIAASVKSKDVSPKVVNALTKVADAVVKVSREERSRALLKDDELLMMSEDELRALALDESDDSEDNA